MSVPVPPHYGLLLDAIEPQDRPRTQLKSVPWDAALGAARWHRLPPRLSVMLAKNPDVPENVAAELESAYMENSARALFIRMALDRALSALTQAGVRAMLLKGSALVNTIYADAGVREMMDIDLLVETAALPAATAVLSELGYLAAPGVPTPREEHHHDQALLDPERLAAIELHFHIASPDERRSFDAADLWERSLPFEAAHRLPAPEDLLLHVAIHFMRDRLGGNHIHYGSGGALSQLADINALAREETLDWDAFVRNARGYGLHARVFLPLFALGELNMTSAPPEVLSRLEPDGFRAGVGRDLVALRVLHDGPRMPVRSLREILAPRRAVLEDAWSEGDETTIALRSAYARRAAAKLPLLGQALRRPQDVVRNYRLNSRVLELTRPSHRSIEQEHSDDGSTPSRRDGVLAQEAQGQTVLLRVDDGSYYAIDEVGAIIWGLADGERSVDAIVDSLSSEFDAPRDVLTSDVLEFVDELLREQLLVLAA